MGVAAVAERCWPTAAAPALTPLLAPGRVQLQLQAKKKAKAKARAKTEVQLQLQLQAQAQAPKLAFVLALPWGVVLAR